MVRDDVVAERPTALALRALGLGDFLTGVPALRALRRGLPDHRLALAAPRALAPLVELAGVVDELHDASGLDRLDWSGPAPDLAVNLHGTGPQSHRLLQATDPGRLVAFDCPEAGHRGPAWQEGEHEVARWCRLLSESLGVPADPHDLGLSLPEQATPVPGAVVVHPGAAFPARCWPAERYAEVARWATDRGCDVVVTGGPAEAALATEVAGRADLPDRGVLAGRTDLGQLAAQVAGARLVVCGDTGVAHLASAFGTPSVVLFGPTSPAHWGPPADGPHLVLWQGDGSGSPWAERPDPALLRIGIADVVGACEEMLAGFSPRLTGSRTTPGSA